MSNVFHLNESVKFSKKYSLYLVSEGTVRNILTKIGNKSKSVCEEIRRRVNESTVAGAEETGQYVNSVFNWAWIF